MRDLIDIHGGSGAVYRFSLFREGHPLSPMGGNFLYVREKADGGHEVVHIGEGQSLLADARRDWAKIAKSHGATHLFTRLNVSERQRRQEHDDIVAGLTPTAAPSLSAAGSRSAS